MLLGANIHKYTHHCNLTYNTLSIHCVLHWCLFIDEFYPSFQFNKGVESVIFDTLSCLFIHAAVAVDWIQCQVHPDNNAKVFSIKLDSKLLLECFLHYSYLPDKIIFHLGYSLLCSQSLQDITLLRQQQNNPDKCPTTN